MQEGAWIRFRAERDGYGAVRVTPPHVPVFGPCLDAVAPGTGLWFGPAFGSDSDIAACRTRDGDSVVVYGVITHPGVRLTASQALDLAEGMRPSDTAGAPVAPEARDALAAAIDDLAGNPLATVVVRARTEADVVGHLRQALRQVGGSRRGLYFDTSAGGTATGMRIVGAADDVGHPDRVPAHAVLVDLDRPVPATTHPQTPKRASSDVVCPGCGDAATREPLRLVVPDGLTRRLGRANLERVHTQNRLRDLSPYECPACRARFHDSGPAVVVAGPARSGATTLLDALERASGHAGGPFPVGGRSGRVRLWADHRGTAWTVVEDSVDGALERVSGLAARGRGGTLLLCVDVAQLPGGADCAEERPGFLREAVTAMTRTGQALRRSPGWAMHTVITKADRVAVDENLEPFAWLEQLGAHALCDALAASGSPVSVVGGLHADSAADRFVSQAGHIFRTVTGRSWGI